MEYIIELVKTTAELVKEHNDSIRLMNEVLKSLNKRLSKLENRNTVYGKETFNLNEAVNETVGKEQ